MTKYDGIMANSTNKNYAIFGVKVNGEPGGTRTLDTLLKRQML